MEVRNAIQEGYDAQDYHRYETYNKRRCNLWRFDVPASYIIQQAEVDMPPPSPSKNPGKAASDPGTVLLQESVPHLPLSTDTFRRRSPRSKDPSTAAGSIAPPSESQASTTAGKSHSRNSSPTRQIAIALSQLEAGPVQNVIAEKLTREMIPKISRNATWELWRLLNIGPSGRVPAELKVTIPAS